MSGVLDSRAQPPKGGTPNSDPCYKKQAPAWRFHQAGVRKSETALAGYFLPAVSMRGALCGRTKLPLVPAVSSAGMRME